MSENVETTSSEPALSPHPVDDVHWCPVDQIQISDTIWEVSWQKCGSSRGVITYDARKNVNGCGDDASGTGTTASTDCQTSIPRFAIEILANSDPVEQPEPATELKALSVGVARVSDPQHQGEKGNIQKAGTYVGKFVPDGQTALNYVRIFRYEFRLNSTQDGEVFHHFHLAIPIEKVEYDASKHPATVKDNSKMFKLMHISNYSLLSMKRGSTWVDVPLIGNRI